jgi:hypothetical protein
MAKRHFRRVREHVIINFAGEPYYSPAQKEGHLVDEKFNQWAMVELYGHQRIVGKVTEATIGGCSFIRVDVPEQEDKPPFTRYFGQGAIYSLNPVSEEIAMELLRSCRNVPVQQYEMPQRMLSGSSEDAPEDEF